MTNKEFQTLITLRLGALNDKALSDHQKGDIKKDERDFITKIISEAKEATNNAFNLGRKNVPAFDSLNDILNYLGITINHFKQVQIQGKNMRHDTFMFLLSKTKDMNELDETIAILGGEVGGEAINIRIKNDPLGNQYWAVEKIYNFDEEASDNIYKKTK